MLNGLPEGGRCPECGKLTQESTSALRTLPAWERPDAGNAIYRFLSTSYEVIFRPSRFYRSLATRGSRRSSARFGRIYCGAAAILFAISAWVHLDWFLGLSRTLHWGASVPAWALIPLSIVTYLFLTVTTRIAARLTNYEATYRGLRLPREVVLRGLDYHAAHYLPVALVAVATVVGYRVALGYSSRLMDWGTTYLYTLCVEVVLAAAYLFNTYWIAMRKMMYASR